MKTTPLLVLLLLCGCASSSKSSYQPATFDEVRQKFHRNAESQDYVWNQWRYAGSDAQFDYIYEYDPGSALPALGFRYYRVPLHEVDVKGARYPFSPALGNNRVITD